MTWNISLRMRRWREVGDFASQIFRLTPVNFLPVTARGILDATAS